jgi:hypothetical protein
MSNAVPHTLKSTLHFGLLGSVAGSTGSVNERKDDIQQLQMFNNRRAGYRRKTMYRIAG